MAKTAKNPNLPEIVFTYRKLLEDKQVSDIKIYDVRGFSPITDFFVVGSVRNERQMQAAGQNLLKELKNMGVKPYSADETLSGNNWVAVDLVDVIVHLFTEEARAEYNIEEIWANRETFFEDLVPAKKAAPKKDKEPEEEKPAAKKPGRKPAAKKETKKPAAKKTTKTKKQ
ncbi:ribosome silencing factor [bacterium]|nr:ribosome silencing factor [bacterium]MBR6462627.1 ribosome silencing factor [bacterium]